MSNPVLLPLLAVGGLLAGSFGGMAVNRIPDPALRLLSPGPRCVRCDHRLHWRDQVPLLSFAILRGRCRHCGDRIARAYPVLEIVMAAAFVAAGLEWGASWTLLPVLLVFWTLIVASVVDLYIYIIPNRLIFPMLGVAALAMAALHLLGADVGLLQNALIGMVGYFLMLAVPFFIYPAGLGFGDVKMALNMGLVLGWLAPTAVDGLVLILWALLIGSLLGVVMGLAVRLLRTRGYDPLPDPLDVAETVPIETAIASEAAGASEAAVSGEAAVPSDEPAEPVEPKKVNSFFPFGPALAAGCIIVAFVTEGILASGS